MEYTLEPLAAYACTTGEGPLYHPGENAIYWTDIPAGRLFRYDLTTAEHSPIEIGRQVGGFTLQADGALLLFMDQGAIALWRKGAPLEYIVDEIIDETATRFNDVIADPEGRVYCGTLPTVSRLGRLYCLDTEGSLTKLLDGIGCANGLGFTPDRKRLYFTDSADQKIWRFDYNASTGALTKRKLFLTTEPGKGVPDGMTVDAEGNLWSARWDGSCLVQYDPLGREVRRIPFPTRKVSSVTFGGPHYDQMFVTTAGGNNPDTEGAQAGTLFRLTIPGVRGLPEYPSQVLL